MVYVVELDGIAPSTSASFATNARDEVKGFHNLLCEQMDRAGVSPQELADCAEVNVATVYKWRSGEVTPRPWRIETIAGCIGINPSKLGQAIFTATKDRVQPQRAASTRELEARIRALEEALKNLGP